MNLLVARLTTYCNNCRAEMGSTLIRERHSPIHHPQASLDDDGCWRSPPGEAVIEMTGLLFCIDCNANPGTTIILTEV